MQFVFLRVFAKVLVEYPLYNTRLHQMLSPGFT
jgi:hypothetical protein